MLNTWRAHCRFLQMLFLFGAMACAPMPADEGSTASEVTSTDVVTAVPSAGTQTGSNGNNATKGGTSGGTATNSFVPPTGTLGKAATYDGASIRWHQNPNLCITRKTSQPTDMDPLTLAPCAADMKQAFYFGGAAIGVNKDYPYASQGDTKQVFVRYKDNVNVDGTSAIYFDLSGDGTTNFLSSTTGFLVPKDPAGKAGTPILLDPASAGGPTSVWDIVGVGNVGGTTMPVTNGNNTYCVIYGTNGLALAGCDRTVAEQRWRYEAGFFVNDNGKCLTCGSPTTCVLQSCSSVSKTLPKNQRFELSIYMNYGTNFNSKTYFLLGEFSTKRAYLGLTSDISNSNDKTFVNQMGTQQTGPFL